MDYFFGYLKYIDKAHIEIDKKFDDFTGKFEKGKK